jgi:non-homologous end joining protein Ku
MLHKDDLSPIKYDRVCAAEGVSVPWNEIVKGYEYKQGKFVVLPDEDFKQAVLESTKTIEILGFVENLVEPLGGREGARGRGVRKSPAGKRKSA